MLLLVVALAAARLPSGTIILDLPASKIGDCGENRIVRVLSPVLLTASRSMPVLVEVSLRRAFHFLGSSMFFNAESLGKLFYKVSYFFTNCREMRYFRGPF